MSKAARFAATLAAALVLVGVVAAGNLDPPGPPAPTGRMTIYQADMPYVITTAGSYVVMEDLSGLSGFSGITIIADEVTVDLNGFTLSGVPGSLNGVHFTIGMGQRGANVTVKNGTIKGWTFNGLISNNSDVKNHLFENLRVIDNGGSGISTGADASVVRGCTVENNGVYGVWGSSATSTITITESRFANNAAAAIRTESGSVVIGNSAYSNGHGASEAAIRVTGDSHVEGNVLHGNYRGIEVSGSGSVISGNSVVGSAERGIYVTGTGNLIVKNSAGANGGADYDIAGSNEVGPIGSAAAATSPFANIEH